MYNQITWAIEHLDLNTIRTFYSRVPEVTMIDWWMQLMCRTLLRRDTSVERAKDFFDAVLDVGSTVERDKLELSPWSLLTETEVRDVC